MYKIKKLPTRNISISEEAYSRLAAQKRPNESFTDVINRITGKRSILELKGLLSGVEARALDREVTRVRKASSRRLESTTETMRTTPGAAR